MHVVRSPRLGLSAVLLVLASLLVQGCTLDVFHDSISTIVEVPAAQFDQPITDSKRFRFERDIGAAKAAFLDRSWVRVEAPAGLDLSFLSSVDIYVLDPVNGGRELFVQGGNFMPGAREQDLEIVFFEDVKRFVQDQRVNLEWEISPNALYRMSAPADTIELRFGLVLEIDTQ